MDDDEIEIIDARKLSWEEVREALRSMPPPIYKVVYNPTPKPPRKKPKIRKLEPYVPAPKQRKRRRKRTKIIRIKATIRDTHE